MLVFITLAVTIPTSLSFSAIAPNSKIVRDTIQRENEDLDCPHFKDCPGCITPKHYTDIPIIKSARLFFSSSSIQQKIIQPKSKLNDDQSYEDNYEDDGGYDGNYYDDEDDYGYDDEPRRNSNSRSKADFYQTIIPSAITEWRTQAKLAVQPKSKWGNGCHFGLYERHTHKVVPIPSCTVHHPSINAAIAILNKATDQCKTPAWREETNGNGLRYVQLSVERMTGRVSMTLVWHASNMKETQPHLARLVKECKKQQHQMTRNDQGQLLFHSIWCHTNDSLGNAIFLRGERIWHPMDGPEFMREVIPGTNVEDRQGLLHFTPMVFRQGNMDGFDEIAMHVARSMDGGSKVCELYAGVGLLGLTSLSYWSNEDKAQGGSGSGDKSLGWLRCSDENPNNPRCFKRTVNTMPSEVTGKLSRKEMNMNQSKSKAKQKRNKGKGQASQETEITLEEMMQQMMESDGSGGSDDRAGPRAQPDAKGKVSYTVASASSALHQGQALGADVLIVDPPRRGLEEEVLVQLCKPHNPKQAYAEDPMFLQGPKYSTNWVNDVHTLIYVSCGFDRTEDNIAQYSIA